MTTLPGVAMLNRLYFVLITGFWVTMNVLLWRSEFSADHELGSAVPVEVVWQKILTAPDNSTMDIFYHGKRVGFCRWAANVGEEVATGKTSTDDYEPEGMVKQLTGYTIDFNGNVALAAITNRLRFDLHMSFSTNHAWRELSLRSNLRPYAWELKSAAADHTLKVKYEDDVSKWEHAFTFTELEDPQKLLREFGLPLPFVLPAFKAEPTRGQRLSLGLDWGARNDWFPIGHSTVRAYRLQARLLERYEIVITTSRVGEILRVELPDKLALVNDALVSY